MLSWDKKRLYWLKNALFINKTNHYKTTKNAIDLPVTHGVAGSSPVHSAYSKVKNN